MEECRKPRPLLHTASLLAIVVLLLSALLSACSWNPATAYALRDEIPLGSLTISVDHWEEISRPPTSLASLNKTNRKKEKLVAVFVRWSPLDDYAPLDRRTHVQGVLTGKLKLVDSNGFWYAARAALPRDIYDGVVHSRISSVAPREWVVVFQVWRGSLGYSLRVQHPDPGPEAIHAAVVPLQIGQAMRPLLAGQPRQATRDR